MGQSQTSTASQDIHFPMQNYLNQGLSQDQVLMVREVFNSYHPHNGLISSHKYRESLQNSAQKELGSRELAHKDVLDFDQFFAIEKQVLLLQLQSNPGIEVDSTQVQPLTNLFCPYAQDVVRN